MRRALCMKLSVAVDWQIVGSIWRITLREVLVCSANDMLGARWATALAADNVGQCWKAGWAWLAAMLNRGFWYWGVFLVIEVVSLASEVFAIASEVHSVASEPLRCSVRCCVRWSVRCSAVSSVLFLCPFQPLHPPASATAQRCALNRYSILCCTQYP